MTEKEWQEYPQINFTTAEQTETYDIFAVVQTDTQEGYFIYQMICDDSEMKFHENVKQIKFVSYMTRALLPFGEIG